MKVAVEKKQYLEWPDAARGLSILGVLFLHATLAVPNGEFSLPARINEFLDPMRMPLFFVVSGFLAAKVLHFSLRELLFKRLWFIGLPYFMWAPVELWLKYREWHHFLDDKAPTLEMVLDATKEGANLLWFLYCLVIVTAFAWITRRLSTPWALAVSFVPLVFLLIPERPIIVNHVMLYLPIFMVGVRLKSLIISFTEHIFHPLSLAATAVTWWMYLELHNIWLTKWSVDFQGWLLPGHVVLSFDDSELVVRLVLRILALPAALTLAVLLTKIPGVFPLLRFFGRNTLVLYIGHGFGLTLLFNYQFLFSGLPFELGATNPLHNTTVWVWACVAFSLIGGAAFHGISRIPVLGWTVKPPAVYQQLVSTKAPAQARSAHRLLLK